MVSIADSKEVAMRSWIKFQVVFALKLLEIMKVAVSNFQVNIWDLFLEAAGKRSYSVESI